MKTAQERMKEFLDEIPDFWQPHISIEDEKYCLGWKEPGKNNYRAGISFCDRNEKNPKGFIEVSIKPWASVIFTLDEPFTPWVMNEIASFASPLARISTTPTPE